MKNLSFLAYSAKGSIKSVQVRKLIPWIVFAAFATVVGAAIGVVVKETKVFAQSGQKKVSLEGRETSNNQIAFSSLRVGESTKDFEKGFTADKGWIGKTSFQIENISSQEIVFLRLKILFPETKAVGNMMAFTFSFGNRPGSSIKTVQPLKLAKGETMTIDLADQFQRITNFVSQRYPIDDITQIDLEASFIVFADGTAWGVGSFMRQDPNDPTTWIPVQLPGFVPTRSPDEEDKK